MEKLPITVTLVALAFALVLWYIAYSLEGDSRWFPDAGQSEAPPDWLSARSDSPVRTNEDERNCAETEDEMRLNVEAARACTSDSDCTLFDYGYPIECLTSVSKKHITSLRLAYREYEKQCEFRVYYDCPTGEVRRRPVCVNNRCAVDLTGNEILTEQTLDHLGIER